MPDLGPLGDPPQGAELELLREYVHLLEEALCMWRWPTKYACTDQDGRIEATCVQAEDSMLRRYHSRRERRGKED